MQWYNNMNNIVTFSTPADLLQRWVKRARESQLSHHLMAERLESQHKWFGILVIIITSTAGATAILSELKGDTKVWLGLITLLATILTALQTFLKLEEKANRHKVAAAGYGDVRRLLELASVLPASIMDARLKQAETTYAKLAIESPSVSKGIYDKAMKRSS